MVINDLDHDVEDLTMEDFPDESPETARYMIAQVGLNQAGKSTSPPLPEITLTCEFQLQTCTSVTVHRHVYT